MCRILKNTTDQTRTRAPGNPNGADLLRATKCPVREGCKSVWNYARLPLSVSSPLAVTERFLPTVVVVDSQARFRAVNWQDLNTGLCNLDIVYRILRFGRRQCLVGVYLATEDAVIVGNQYGAQGYFVYRRNGCLMEARSCERIRVLAIREGGMLRSKSFAYITAADFMVR